MTTGGRPRVSVGMPVYNGERFLREAIDSILSQDYQDLELIISDNASTDGTGEICQEYVGRDPRVRYNRNEQNMGAAKNYNLVFELARGEYFKWAPADDVCVPGYFQKCVDVLDCNPDIVLCAPKTLMIDEGGAVIERYPEELHLQAGRPHERYRSFHERFHRLQKCNAILGLLRSSSLGKTQLIGSYASSDMVLLGELAILGKMYEIPEYLFMRRDHPQSSVRAYRLHERAAWFDPRYSGKYQYANWRLLIEQTRSVTRTPVRLAEKLLCYLEVWKWARWNRSGLQKELIVFAYSAADRLPRFLYMFLRSAWRLASLAGRTLRGELRATAGQKNDSQPMETKR